MRQLYAERRAALAWALHEANHPMLNVETQPGGMHLLARLPSGTDDVALVARLLPHGFAPTSLSACGARAPRAPGLLLGFTNVEASRAAGVARRFVEALDQAGDISSGWNRARYVCKALEVKAG